MTKKTDKKINKKEKSILNRINVLHVIDHLSFGGAQTLLLGLLKNWNDKNIRLFGYCLRRKKVEVDNKLVFLPKSKSKYSFFPLFELNNFIKENKVDILHLHLEKSIIFGVLLKLIFNKKIKIIAHEHGGIFENNFWYIWFLKIFKDKIDLFIAISKATKRKLIEDAGVPESKVVLLYNFIDLDKFNYNNIKKFDGRVLRTELGVNKESFIVGFAGRLIERKGWKEFLEAAKILNDPCYRFLIVGSGEDEQKLNTFIQKNNLNKKVTHLGYIDDIRVFYSAINNFVIPSHWEPMGITELEAQSLGIPVIASNVPGLNEVIEDNDTGLLFKPKNPEDLARKIELLRKDEDLRRRLVKKGYLRVKRFSVEKYTQKLKRIYKEIENV